MKPSKNKWNVTRTSLTPGGQPVTEVIEVEAFACEVQNGALLFWDGGLKRAFGAGAWSECTEVDES